MPSLPPDGASGPPKPGRNTVRVLEKFGVRGKAGSLLSESSAAPRQVSQPVGQERARRARDAAAGRRRVRAEGTPLPPAAPAGQAAPANPGARAKRRRPGRGARPERRAATCYSQGAGPRTSDAGGPALSGRPPACCFGETAGPNALAQRGALSEARQKGRDGVSWAISPPAHPLSFVSSSLDTWPLLQLPFLWSFKSEV